MKFADIKVGMDVAVRTSGVTADDIRSGRAAVLGTVTHVGKWRLAKQGLCEASDVVPADYPGASNVVVVRVPILTNSYYRARGRALLDNEGNLRKSEYLIVESGQIYPIGLFTAAYKDRQLVIAERDVYSERMKQIRKGLLEACIVPHLAELVDRNILKFGDLRIETYPRQRTNGTRYRVGEARFTISDTSRSDSKESNPLWTWLKDQAPVLCAEYDDLQRRVNECAL